MDEKAIICRMANLIVDVGWNQSSLFLMQSPIKEISLTPSALLIEWLDSWPILKIKEEESK